MRPTLRIRRPDASVAPSVEGRDEAKNAQVGRGALIRTVLVRTQLLGKRQAQAMSPPPGRRAYWVAALAVVGLGLSSCSLFRREAPPAEQVGVASWYGAELQGSKTATGERFAADGLTAAHPSLPLGTRVLVTNLANGRSVVVRINDRGPFVGGRVLDVSRGAARALGMLGSGTARVRITPLATTGRTEIAPVTGHAVVRAPRSGARRVPRRRRRHSHAMKPARKRSER